MYTFSFLIKSEINMQNKNVITHFESFFDHKPTFYKQFIEMQKQEWNILFKCIDRPKIQN